LEGTPVVGKILISYMDKGREKIYKMKKNSIIIGRSTKADIYIPDPKLSRNHARIEINSKNVVVTIEIRLLF
jgi:pSer/pThr/pTyr-binding forkhead associated (FHA) protein